MSRIKIPSKGKEKSCDAKSKLPQRHASRDSTTEFSTVAKSSQTKVLHRKGGIIYIHTLFLGRPCARRSSKSPSTSHLLALTNCTTFRNCFPAMIGNDTPAMTHGQKLSILFALASSIAHALPGLVNKVDAGFEGFPG